MKKLVSLALAVCLCLALAVPAGAVSWAAEQGLTAGLTFEAKDPCPRSDVVYCLWRQLA